jgi:hypothetical protein
MEGLQTVERVPLSKPVIYHVIFEVLHGVILGQFGLRISTVPWCHTFNRQSYFFG